MIDKYGRDETDLGLFPQDVLTNLLMVFVVILVVVLVLINPSKKKTATETTAPPGNILVESFWQITDPGTNRLINTDVDQWVAFMGGPTSPPERAAGYSNKGGKTYNLLRDDLGNRPGQDDNDPVNYELTTSRGVPVGTHCVNLHLYKNGSSLNEIPVKVSVRIARALPGFTSDGSQKLEDATEVLTSTVILRYLGQEYNVFCFSLDAQGKVEKEKTYRSDSICLRSPDGCEDRR